MDELQYYTRIGKVLYGGMGQVFHLRHKLWDMDLAMKQPLPRYMQNEKDKQRFHAECERWMGLGIHPNLVQCFFVQQVDGIPCAFSEWIGNGSLSQHIKGPLYIGSREEAFSRILDVAIQAAMGLQFSHQNGILHLDVKPGNILLERDGSAKLTDFGISSLLNVKSTKVSYTPLYCAPEQKAGGQIGKYTDIYCWAVTVLHMLVREAVWADGAVAGYAYEEYLQQAVVPVPPVLHKILGRCLQEDPANRPGDFDYVLEELLALWRTIFHHEYPRLYRGANTITWDAMNNRGISYMEMGKPQRAKQLWQKVNQESLGHVQAYYNDLLYGWRFEGRAEVTFSMHTDDAEHKFAREKNKTKQRGEGYLHYLESRWAYSTGAYELACQYAKLAVKRSPKDPVNADNLAMVTAYRDKHGPALISKIKLSEKLAVYRRMVHLGFMPDGNLIAVSSDGKMEIFKSNGEVIRRAKTKLTGINLAAVSRSGKYLALARASKTKTDGGYPWEIRVYDLQTMKGPLKITGSVNALRLLTILDGPGEACRVVAKFTNETLEWEIPVMMQSWIEGQGLKFGASAALFDDLFGAVALISADRDHYLGMSGHECMVWDSRTMKMRSRKQIHGIHQCPKLNLTPVPGKPYVLHGTVRGGYEVVDFKSMRVITREVLQPIDGGAGLRRPDYLAVSPDGKAVALCWGDELQLWRLPDYTRLPDPLWAVCRFRDSDLTVQQKREFDAALVELQEDLYRLEHAGGMLPAGSSVAMMIKRMGVIKEFCWNVDDYLALSARACRFLPVTDLDVSRRRGVNSLVGITCQLQPPPGTKGRFEVFTSDGRFSARQDGHQILLLRSSDKAVLETLNVGYASAMGFSADLRYLVRVCNDKVSKYELFLLEWLFEETPE